MPSYWLMKTEPDVFCFDDFRKAPKQTTSWEGVRNYQARNYMRDQVKKGDKVLIYHSNSEPSGVFGTAEVVKEAYPDETALDPKSEYFDELSHKEGKSRWVKIDLRGVAALANPISLSMIKADNVLSKMVVAQKGSRLSVTPVTESEWHRICELGKLAKL